MYTEEEYQKRIKELRPVAQDIMDKYTPDEAREIVSKMNPEDAYIVGIWIGKTMQLAIGTEELNRVITGITVMVERRPEVNGDFRFN